MQAKDLGKRTPNVKCDSRRSFIGPKHLPGQSPGKGVGRQDRRSTIRGIDGEPLFDVIVSANHVRYRVTEVRGQGAKSRKILVAELAPSRETVRDLLACRWMSSRPDEI